MEWKPAPEGVFYGLSEEVYRSAPGINNSTLKLMRRSPRHYLNALENPEHKDSPALLFGRLVHQAILETHRPQGYVIRPEGMKFNTKEGKAWRDGQTLPVIDLEDAERITSIAGAVHEHPLGKEIMAGSTEVSVFKKDPSTGLLLKARIDCMAGSRIIDIKTTEDASAASFAKSCQAFGYARQAAFYGMVTGCWDFTFLAVEKEAPYACQAFRIAKGCIQTAIQQIRLDLDRIKECITLQDWPSYDNSTKEIEIYV